MHRQRRIVKPRHRNHRSTTHNIYLFVDALEMEIRGKRGVDFDSSVTSLRLESSVRIRTCLHRHQSAAEGWFVQQSMLFRKPLSPRGMARGGGLILKQIHYYEIATLTRTPSLDTGIPIRHIAQGLQYNGRVVFKGLEEIRL